MARHVHTIGTMARGGKVRVTSTRPQPTPCHKFKGPARAGFVDGGAIAVPLLTLAATLLGGCAGFVDGGAIAVPLLTLAATLLGGCWLLKSLTLGTEAGRGEISDVRQTMWWWALMHRSWHPHSPPHAHLGVVDELHNGFLIVHNARLRLGFCGSPAGVPAELAPDCPPFVPALLESGGPPDLQTQCRHVQLWSGGTAGDM